VNNSYFIKAIQLSALLNRLRDNHKVFVPAIKEDPSDGEKKPEYTYCLLSDEVPLIYNPYRTIEPLKSFFTPVYEKLADYFNAEGKIPLQTDKIILFGVKSCDIAGHKVQDFVFSEGVEADPLYKIRRENTIFISGDCTDYKEVCHCLAWEILPYPAEGFDLNLSPLNDGYILQVGSTKGWELIQQYKDYFVLAKDAQVAANRQKRENFIQQLKNHIAPQNLVSKEKAQDLVRRGYELDTWQQFMLTCVECGGCNLICDTCHCFLLADEKYQAQNAKVRVWDSCLYANYARVAGGANPLKLRKQRLRNRFVKKFDFFIDNLGMPACCGCGRCIEVCPGKIDIREVLKDLAKKLNVG